MEQLQSVSVRGFRGISIQCRLGWDEEIGGAGHCCRQNTRPYVQLHGCSLDQVAELENAVVVIALSTLASIGFQSLHVEVPNADGPVEPVHTPQLPR